MRIWRSLLLVVLAWAVSNTVHASGFPTPEEALALLYPGGELRSESVFLTEEQKKAADTTAGEPLPSRLFKRFIVTPAGKGAAGAIAYLDSHRVRTSGQTLLIVLDPALPSGAARVRRIEVVAFFEPREYQPREKWLGQFAGQGLSEELRLKRAIQPITGATLTARAVTAAARRVLAVHAVAKGPAQ
ncbi:MAG: FMN-binding protein [Oligoflexia bacterium]|nr:FMN-binding protein [Oligoflexia bacterium]